MSLGRLVFDGDIELLDGAPSDEGYWFEAVEGMEFGQPVPVTVILTSLLRDGALVAKTGDDNREVSIPLRVRGSDLLNLAAGEARISRAVGKRTTLEWTPPDGYGPTTVFDVMTSDLDNPPHDDLAELRNRRTYTLRLTCLPFGRSVGKIIDNAGTPPSSGGTVFLNCESAQGWSSAYPAPTYPPYYTVDSTVYTEGAGSIRCTAESVQTYGDDQWKVHFYDQVTGLNLQTGAGGYISFAVRGQYSDLTLFGLYVTTDVNGRVEVPGPVATGRDSNGFVHYAFPIDGGLTVTALEFRSTQITPHLRDPVIYAWYDDFEILSAATTDHQIVKQLDVKGSARTTASLHIAAPGDSIALGQVLAITVATNEIPPGSQPDGARWATQGATTPDATALHGQYYTPSTTTYDAGTGKPIFDVPLGMFPSALDKGAYTIVALVKSGSSPLSFGVKAQLLVGSTLTGPTSVAEVTTPVATGVWQFVTVGTVYLPPVPMQAADASAKVRLLFKGAAFADVFMVPAWESNGREVADFSIVDCGAGIVSAAGASSNLWIDSPSIENKGLGGWWRGPSADRTNTRSAWPDAKKPGLHTFEPGGLSAFLVSTGAQGPTLTLEYFPAWRTNAAL